MSLDNIKNAIKEFLNSKTPEVLCLRGKWGVGKTYLWKHYYEELKKNNSVKLKNYSYVSLFGVESIQDLKLAILSQSDNFLKKAIATGSSLAKDIPFIDQKKVVTGVGFSFIEKSLVCLDDIERKSDSLKMEDVLGFICYLRDEKNCKVIMLQNSDALEKADAGDMKKYAEKIIDHDITLETTAEDAANIVFGDKKETELLRKNIIKFGINNIRIVKKIQNHATRILDHLPQGKYQEETIKSALGTLCLYCDIHYAPSPDKPTIEFVMKHYSFGVTRDEDESKEKWKRMLHNYDYRGTNDLDREIFSFIKNGYINPPSFEKAASDLDVQYEVGTVENEFKGAWSLYHDSLQDNATEVLDELYRCFKNAMHTISPMNLNGVYTLFKDLGDDTRAKEMLEFYIKVRSATPELFNPDSGRLWLHDKPHSDVKEAFEQTFQIHKKNNPIPFNEGFERIAESKGNDDDKESLRNASIEEFYNFYKGLDKKNVHSYIQEALEFETYSDNRAEIGTKARKALEKLAAESQINQHRLKRFGITIN